MLQSHLHGHGDSSKPIGLPNHSNCAKRTLARDQVALMQGLGFARFDVLAHDRGARVAHRLAVDHPERVGRMVLLDMAPTLAMYEQTTRAFATAFWHWFLQIQQAPLPERLIQAERDGVIATQPTHVVVANQPGDVRRHRSSHPLQAGVVQWQIAGTFRKVLWERKANEFMIDPANTGSLNRL